MNTKFLLVAASLLALSACGKGDFNGRYQGYEMQSGQSNSMYGASQASMDLRQDGDLVTGTYTAQRQMQGSVTYQINARAEKSDSLDGIQMFQTNTATGGTGGWGGWGGGTTSYCQLLTGSLAAPDDGRQLSGSIAPANAAQATGCSFTLSLTKMQ